MKVSFAATFSILVLLSGQLVLSQSNLPPEVLSYPDWVFYNGIILTADSDAPPIRSVQAVAVRGNRILASGTTDRILAMTGPDTEKVDLQRKTMMPGVIDTHSHPNRYALSDYQRDIPEEIRQNMYPLEVDFDVQSKEELLERIRAAVEKAPENLKWLATVEPGSRNLREIWRSLRKEDLDGITSDRPLAATWRSMGPVNSKAIEALITKFGSHLPGIVRDASGEPTGWVEGIAAWVVYTDMRPSLPPRYLAEVYRKELQEWVALGVTTLSTRLSGHEISGYAKLARSKQLPLRMAFSHDGIGRWNPLFEWYLGRLGNLQDFGYKDMMWLIGLSLGIPDGGPEGGSVASRAPKINPLPTDATGQDSVAYWDREGDPTAEHVVIANRHGYRIAGIHTFGDLGLEMLLDAYTKALEEDNEVESDYPPFTLDHLMMVSPGVLAKMQRLTDSGRLNNLVLSVQTPMYFGRRSATVRGVYGEEVFWNWLQPNRSMKQAGSILTYGADTGGDPNRQPMHSLEVIVSRANHEGVAINPNEALTREEGLLMLTRWGRYYVGRDDLGSIEPGNLADLVILDRNPLSGEVAVGEISEIEILMTMVDGEPGYVAPDFQF